MRRVRWLWAAACLLPACFEDSLGPDPGGGSEATGTVDGTAGEASTLGGPGHTDDAGTVADASATEGPADTGTVDTTDEGPTTDDGGSQCPRGSQCSAAPPPDWTGPFAVPIANGERPAPCPARWPDPVTEVHSELSAPPLGCACSCAPPSSVCTASVALHLDDTCTLLDVEQQVDAGACVQTLGATTVLATATVDPTPPACAAEVETTDAPPAWGATASLCAPTMRPPTCDDGICVPAVGPPICIVREGEHPCPEGPYRAGSTWFTGVQDERACTSCTCGTPSGMQCEGVLSALEQHDSGDCSGASVDSVMIGACGVATTSARYVPQDLGACTAVVDTEPVGQATPAGPVTVCCAESYGGRMRFPARSPFALLSFFLVACAGDDGTDDVTDTGTGAPSDGSGTTNGGDGISATGMGPGGNVDSSTGAAGSDGSGGSTGPAGTDCSRRGCECEGLCYGVCQLNAGASCEGLCMGTCAGNCEPLDDVGNCNGTCDGMCEGLCTVEQGAACNGTCHGTCVVG